jgi:hypothetical protein
MNRRPRRNSCKGSKRPRQRYAANITLKASGGVRITSLLACFNLPSGSSPTAFRVWASLFENLDLPQDHVFFVTSAGVAAEDAITVAAEPFLGFTITGGGEEHTDKRVFYFWRTRTKEKARRGNDSKRRKKIHSPLFPSLTESVCLPGSFDGHHGHMARMPCHTRQECNKPSSHKSSQCVKKGGK